MTDDLQAFYGRWARLYDLIARFPGVGTWRAAAADALRLDSGDTVIEMGCGTGANLPYLRERVGPEGRVIGIDLTAGMLAVARERVDRRGWENVSLLRADAARPPVPESARSVEARSGFPGEASGIDAVLASFVSGMFADPAPVIERWYSLCSPGGRLCLLDAARSSRSIARPLDLAFRAFVLASTPPVGQLRYEEPPWAELDRRVGTAHRTLAARCSAADRATYGLGFVHLTAGTLA